MEKNLKMLNLGCGTRYHADWTNIDFKSSDKNVIEADLNRGIPYPDAHFDVVYHSHVLEHFARPDAERFLKECHRVLKPGGILRIAVPNLEPIAKNYIAFLDKALSGDKMAEANYDWTLLEMYDQCVRNHGGGEMKNYFKQNDIINKDFIRDRIGYFFDLMTEAHHVRHRLPSWKENLKKMLFIDKIRKAKQALKKAIPGLRYRAIGKFRSSGEIHQWMYDRFSLSRLLKDSGFTDAVERNALTSFVSGWAGYDLDTEPDGSTYKADSLFMEAKKQ